ncbi:MAG: M42 family metallopeptidase [Chloroflexi bacterium]|nr:M42 family metallopeptidase [Chloroflexota bacterium]
MSITKKKSWNPPKIGRAQISSLEKLSEASGVSGNEDAVRKIVIDEIKAYADEYEIDALGNVLVTKRGSKKNLPRVMLAAHMDEVGFMLVHDEGEGLFRFDIVGGIDRRQIISKPVWVGKKRIPGVIAGKPIHLTTPKERSNVISVDTMRIDLGPGNSKKGKSGDWATFATKFMRQGQTLRGKALDDRVGVASLIELLKNAPPNIHLLAAFTVQEEVGLRGAKVAGYAINPDMAIVLECTPALDMPTWDGSENTLYRTKLNQGPAIYIADRATLPDPRLVRLLQETAEAYDIPYQLRQPGVVGGTDAGAIHLQRSGIPSISISVPARYLHTPASLIRLADWRNTLALVHTALSHITPNTLKGERQ